MCSDLTSHGCPLYIKTSVSQSDSNDILHAQAFSKAVYQKCVEQNIKAELSTPKAPSKHNNFIDFLMYGIASVVQVKNSLLGCSLLCAMGKCVVILYLH